MWKAHLLTGINRFRNSRIGPIVKAVLTVAFFLCFALLLGLLLWKCPYGYASQDETFYLATALRLLRGDHMLVDEWHMTQFSSLILIPSLWVYLRIAGTTEGMVLSFRIIYTVLWGVASLFLYFRVRHFHEHGARCASLLMLCYAPYGIMAFSYNSLGILFLVNTAVFLLCARRLRRAQQFISGIFFAAAVLCCPYLAFIYVLYTTAIISFLIRKNGPTAPAGKTDIVNCWFFFTLGVLLLALLFLGMVFSGASMAELEKAIPLVFQDEEHLDFSLQNKTSIYLSSIAHSNSFFWPMLILLGFAMLLQRFSNREIWLCVVCGVVFLYLRCFMQEKPYLNYLMLPLTFGGIYVLAATRQKNLWKIARLWLIPGILYTFCLNYSSNQHFYAISSAATVSSLAGELMLWMHCDELRKAAKRAGCLFLCGYAAVAMLFAGQMRYLVPFRIQTVFQEPGLMKYEEQHRIQQGPQKGLLATVDNAEEYNRIFDDIHDIHGKKVLYLSGQTWMYLMNDNEIASFSAWLGEVDEKKLKRLQRYYSLRPQKKPELIYIPEENVPFALSFLSPEAVNIQQTENGSCLVFLYESEGKASPEKALDPGTGI